MDLTPRVQVYPALPRRGGANALSHAVQLAIVAGNEDGAYALTVATVRASRLRHYGRPEHLRMSPERILRRIADGALASMTEEHADQAIDDMRAIRERSA